MKYLLKGLISLANLEAKVGDTRVKERAYIVKWMKGIIAEKTSISEQKAFMAKSNSICIYHNITLEELILGQLESGKRPYDGGEKLQIKP